MDTSFSESPMEEWKWQQFVWWVQLSENFPDFARIFGEFHINGQEFAYLKSHQIGLLIDCQKSRN